MRNKIKRLAVTAALATALFALTASSAMAGVANWSTTASGFKLSGTLTVKKNGGSAKTCTGTSTIGSALASGGFTAANFSPGVFRLSCGAGSYFIVNATGYADYTAGAYSLVFDPWYGGDSPWGGLWYQDAFQVPFTNASGGNPSKITFSDTLMGVTAAFENVTATGTLNVTTSAGGTLTLTP